jgi:hypothetical protein
VTFISSIYGGNARRQTCQDELTPGLVATLAIVQPTPSFFFRLTYKLAGDLFRIYCTGYYGRHMYNETEMILLERV